MTMSSRERRTTRTAICDCFARFMPECGPIFLSQQKTMGENHDNFADLSGSPTPRRRLQPPQGADWRSSACRFGRDHANGLCGERSAARPDRRSDPFNRPAAFGATARKPLSGFSSRVMPSPSFRSALTIFRPSPAPWRLSGLRLDSAGLKARSIFRQAAMCCSATFPTIASCGSRRMTATSACTASHR